MFPYDTMRSSKPKNILKYVYGGPLSCIKCTIIYHTSSMHVVRVM